MCVLSNDLELPEEKISEVFADVRFQLEFPLYVYESNPNKTRMISYEKLILSFWMINLVTPLR